ncbi:PREDICTED: uncharacterized protein LOC109477719 [Branchiostoma belcheri]|uniref:Uncharacterized protein LOC109477719 n=1 Tax=Branchiostoma belcheri TaxID=7741 RepID=A0A6P4ZD61_BRABE|nr:PREDICTED: uncharacterized protein LOC109477719 [Branchiostoma belcheri]
MSRRRGTSRRKPRRSRAATFPASDGDDNRQDGRLWWFEAAVITVLLLAAVTAPIVAVTLTPHTSADSEAAVDVTYSVHAGEPTPIHLKPAFEDGTHGVHSVPYGSEKTSNGSPPITRLEDPLEGAVPWRVAEMFNKMPSFQSWKKHRDEQRHRADRIHHYTSLTAALALSALDERDDFGYWDFGDDFGYLDSRDDFDYWDFQDDFGYSDLLVPGNHFQLRHSKNDKDTVPADFDDRPLQDVLANLDSKAVRNPFKNVGVGQLRAHAERLMNSAVPRFEALKRYWDEQMLSQKDARHVNHLLHNVKGRKTYRIERAVLEDEGRRHTHSPKASPDFKADDSKNSDVTPVNTEILSATDAIPASKPIQLMSEPEMSENDCLDDTDKDDENFADWNHSLNSTMSGKMKDQDETQLLLQSKTALTVVVGTLVVTSVIYEYGCTA